MKIKLNNIGVIQQADLSLGDLTVICGKNDTGKTYVTNALYGFLSSWRKAVPVSVSDSDMKCLMQEGTVDVDTESYIRDVNKIIKNGCEFFSKNLSHTFASAEERFSESSFVVELSEQDIHPMQSFERVMQTTKSQFLSISKKPDSRNVTVSLLAEKEKVSMSAEFIKEIVEESLKEILFGNLFPRPFIVSAERTGVAIFRKELDFAHNRLLEDMVVREERTNPMELFSKAYSDYALPVKQNMDFIRNIECVSRKESFLQKEHPEILKDFAHIIGGSYKVTKNDEIYFVPKGSKGMKLTMGESSSAARSLLDIAFYLQHEAEKGDLLMVDEPELNLHPENHRRIARLFSRLVNVGIMVFITTHSDYIIKEFNILIMLNQKEKRFRKLSERKGYHPDELLDSSKVRAFVAGQYLAKIEGKSRRKRIYTLDHVRISQELGIEVESFDDALRDMSGIERAIFWGNDDEEEEEDHKGK